MQFIYQGKKYFLLLMLIALLVSCTKRKIDSNFSIENNCTGNIFVEYVTLDSNDTFDLQILPNESSVLWGVTHDSQQESNWYYDFGISIIYIKNLSGDIVEFNPNVESYWQLHGPNPNFPYVLYISDYSFP